MGGQTIEETVKNFITEASKFLELKTITLEEAFTDTDSCPAKNCCSQCTLCKKKVSFDVRKDHLIDYHKDYKLVELVKKEAPKVEEKTLAELFTKKENSNFYSCNLCIISQFNGWTLTEGRLHIADAHKHITIKEEAPKEEKTLEELFTQDKDHSGFYICTLCNKSWGNREAHLRQHHKEIKIKEEEKVPKAFKIRERRPDEDYHPAVIKALNFYDHRLTFEEKEEVKALAKEALEFTISQPIYLEEEGKEKTMPQELKEKLDKLASPYEKNMWKAYFKYKEGWEEEKTTHPVSEIKKGTFFLPTDPGNQATTKFLPCCLDKDFDSTFIRFNGTQGNYASFPYNSFRRPELSELIAYFTQKKFLN
jgi:hypothetical protein